MFLFFDQPYFVFLSYFYIQTFFQNERKANHGNCAQPCRWSYKLVESTRPDEYYEINQDERGSHILSPKDLCLVKYIKDLVNAGVNSLKVEGRTKSLYYVSAVAKTYRNAIDELKKDENADMDAYVIQSRLKEEGTEEAPENPEEETTETAGWSEESTTL